MSFRIGLLLAVLVILAAGLWFIPSDGFMNFTGKGELNTFTAASPTEYKPQIYPARNTVPAGPGSPNQQAPAGDTRISTPEVAMDPYAPNEESASIPERLRHPDRMFRPAPDNNTVEIAEASGIASASANQAANALQAFAPEMAQNGGEFMNGIFANDAMETTGYSAF